MSDEPRPEPLVEPDLIDVRAVTLALLIGTIAVVGCVVLVRAAYPDRPAVSELSAGTLRLPEPRLQLDPERDLQRMRELETLRLRGGGGRPSIEQAMARVIEREHALADAPAPKPGTSKP